MTQGSASNREDVEQLGRRFEEFRRTHPVRSRLPEELWAAAAKLARRDGIEATAQALDVDRPSLQKWTDRFEPRAASKAAQASTPASAARTRACGARLRGTAGGRTPVAAASCLVEVESPRGAKLRLELKAIPTSELAELIRAFAAS